MCRGGHPLTTSELQYALQSVVQYDLQTQCDLHYKLKYKCNQERKMKKVQCTFRLPEEVVALIDKQEGETRTDKLLSILNVSLKADEGVMQNVISDALQSRLLTIESRLEALEKKKTSGNNSANQKRKTETIEYIRNELNTLEENQINALKTARYPLSEIRKLTKISKSQCDSYSTMIKEILDI